MMSGDCPTCGQPWRTASPPPEPPVGTWVKDRHGGTHVRTVDRDGRDGWAASPTGFYAGGARAAMWEARGPLVVCGPWGVGHRDTSAPVAVDYVAVALAEARAPYDRLTADLRALVRELEAEGRDVKQSLAWRAAAEDTAARLLALAATNERARE